MANKEEPKRKRMVVEEIGVSETPVVEEERVTEIAKPEILEKAAKDGFAPESEPTIEKKEHEEVKETRIVKPKKSPSIALWIIIPGIFLLGAILGGIVFYQRGVNSGQLELPSSTANPTVLPTVSPSPVAKIDLGKYTISVFNGSGISGEAGKAKTLLTTDGFKVGSTANAATYDYTKTVIKAKSTVEASFISALASSLGKTYSVDTPQTLASSSADTIQVVIGSSKAQ